MSKQLTVVLPDNYNIDNVKARIELMLEGAGGKGKVVLTENVGHDMAEVLLLIADLQLKLKALSL